MTEKFWILDFELGIYGINPKIANLKSEKLHPKVRSKSKIQNRKSKIV